MLLLLMVRVVCFGIQRSGKSLSMVFYAHLLQEALESPTIVVLTDRNEIIDGLAKLQIFEARTYRKVT